MKTIYFKGLIYFGILLLTGIAASGQSDPYAFQKNNKTGDGSTGGLTGVAGNSNSTGSSGYLNNYFDLGEECTMYLDENWSAGKLRMKDSNDILERMMRYNLYNQQIEYIEGEDTIAIGNPENLASVSFGGHNFVYDRFGCSNIVKTGFLEVLVDGSMDLYLYRCIRFTYVDDAPGSDEVQTRYFIERRFLYSKGDGLITKLPDKKKQVIALCEDQGKDVRLFLKANKNKLKNGQDFIDLFNFVND